MLACPQIVGWAKSLVDAAWWAQRANDFAHPALPRSALLPTLLILSRDRRIHLHVAAALVAHVAAEREVVAVRSHARLAFEIGRPVAELVAVPWILRAQRRQAERFLDGASPLHVFAVPQRHRREGAFERSVDQPRRGFGVGARAARTVVWMVVRHHQEIVLR